MHSNFLFSYLRMYEHNEDHEPNNLPETLRRLRDCEEFDNN